MGVRDGRLIPIDAGLRDLLKTHARLLRARTSALQGPCIGEIFGSVRLSA